MNRVRVIALIVLGIVTTLGLAGVHLGGTDRLRLFGVRASRGLPRQLGKPWCSRRHWRSQHHDHNRRQWDVDADGSARNGHYHPNENRWVFDPVNQVVTGARQGVEFRGTPQAETDYMGLAMGAT